MTEWNIYEKVGAWTLIMAFIIAVGRCQPVTVNVNLQIDDATIPFTATKPDT